MSYSNSTSGFEAYRKGETTLEISLMVKMVMAVRGFRGQLDEKLRKIGQSTSRMETMSAIMNMPDPKSQTDVARRLRVEGATVTRMVDILSKEGLVQRTPDPGDRRVNLLSITPAGEAVLRDIFSIYDASRAHFLADLSHDDLAAMHGVLDRMMDRLDHPGTGEIHISNMPPMDRLLDVPSEEDGGGFVPER